MKIVVTGSKGQLGSEIKFLSPQHEFGFIFIDLEELDLTKLDEIPTYLSTQNPDFIINCAAYTAVDRAEDEFVLADIINAKAPAKIAQYCAESGCRLIHISTDYVFDGNFKKPIEESDKPNPRSVYGKTKLAGENAILILLSNAYIIRTSWVYSEFGNNFVKTMLRLGNEKADISVVSDQVGTPTWARDLAETILKIIHQIEVGKDHPGIYHFSNGGTISWYNFGYEIMNLANLNCKVHPISTSDYPTRAERPQYSVLSKSKIKSQLEINIPHWKESLKSCLNNM
jgi:dTDP-4-dehydrorhamnose reductase